MKITRKNYFEQIGLVDFKTLPEELKQAHIVLMVRTDKGRNWNAVTNDAELKQVADVAFEKLGEFLSIGTPTKQKPATVRKFNSYYHIEKEVKFIYRLLELHDKIIYRNTLEVFIDQLQTAIKEKQIRKTSPVANDIMKMQDAVIRIYNSMDSAVHFVLKPETIKKFKSIIVKYENALDAEERPEREKPKAKSISLEGTPASTGRLMSSTDFVKLNFQRIGFTGKWLDLIGDPAPGFTAMVFGKPKFGKSFLCIEWAGYLARHHGKVLYAAKEEGLDATLQEKLKEKDVEHPNLTVSDYIPNDLSAYDFIFLDSVNKFGLSPQDLEKLKKQNPGKSFIYIFQSTKEGKFRGTNAYQHDVDIVIEVPEHGKAVQFGRFNQGGEMNIFDEEPQGETEPALNGIRKRRAQLKNSKRVAHYHRYFYVIDLDERGSFRAHVEDQAGQTVFEFVSGNELAEDESDLFQDGWMRGKNDIEGLEKYLRDRGIIGRYDQLVPTPGTMGGIRRRPRKAKESKEKITIETEFSMALEELAVYLLKPSDPKQRLLELIYEQKPYVEKEALKIASRCIKTAKADVSIKQLNDTQIDSENLWHGAAYFRVILEGTMQELQKIAGVDKVFYYDWDEHPQGG